MPIRYNFLLALEIGRTPILPELLLMATSDNTSDNKKTIGFLKIKIKNQQYYQTFMKVRDHKWF